MLMLFLVTAVPLEMAHDINHLQLLSPHYGLSAMLQAECKGGGVGGAVECAGVLSYGDDLSVL